MRLLSSETLRLEDFENKNEKPDYAILSHTWDKDEVSFQDMQSGTEDYKRKAGYQKIVDCCRQARRDGILWVWIDVCCINKDSDPELNAALNAMFKWYAEAKIAYAYLCDVPGGIPYSLETVCDALRECRWFRRGWVLQETLAPKELILFGQDWAPIGTRANWSEKISEFSHIHKEALISGGASAESLQRFSVAQRMSWASNREVTKSEDIAYCLLGLFNVHLTPRYGEGAESAFIRLQKRILKSTEDQSLFAWQDSSGSLLGPLADHPKRFKESSTITPILSGSQTYPSSMINESLSIKVDLVKVPQALDSAPGAWFAILNCCRPAINGDRVRVGLPLTLLYERGDEYARCGQDLKSCSIVPGSSGRTILIRKEIKQQDRIYQPDPNRVGEFVLWIPESHFIYETYGDGTSNSTNNILVAPDARARHTYVEDTWANWRVVCRVNERPHPSYLHGPGHFFLIVGYDMISGEAWCDIRPVHGNKIDELCEEVKSGSRAVKGKILSKKTLTITVDMTEDDGLGVQKGRKGFAKRKKQDRGKEKQVEEYQGKTVNLIVTCKYEDPWEALARKWTGLMIRSGLIKYK